MNSEVPFSFSALGYNTSQVFYARLDPDICRQDDLLRALYYLLWFPGYFGFNWNALWDCLMDFSWIKERKIVLVHSGLPKIPEDDLKIYLEILRDAMLGWKPNEEHCFEVVFNECDRQRIVSLLCNPHFPIASS